ncbi:MAG TPA: MerR family transcriptional regulator [Candidatus Binataceae bacterium]|nr:MerR family transcriptional regulator [Candidatus Binataceae bacterium]
MNRNRRPTQQSEPKKTKAAARLSDASASDDRGLKIGEAAKVIGVEAYVLRFWETQFAVLKPKHARSKHRFYQPRDIETLKLIKRLLHQEGFTIAGANKYIRENGIDPSNIASSADAARPAPSSGTSSATRRALAEVRRDLENIHKLLGDE